MKLLFDQNLSARLVRMLVDLYPGSNHVRLIGMSTDEDEVIWQYAQRHDFVIVSKDADFFHRSMRYGLLLKIIWNRSGNCTTEIVAQLLRRHLGALHAFAEEADAAFLPLE